MLLVTLEQARAWVETERFAEAAALLAVELPCMDASRDVGVRVRARALHGDALTGLGRLGDAEQELLSASQLWASESALAWVRGLPSGDTSAQAVQRASNAAARATLHVADLRLRALELPPPVFAPGNGPVALERRAFVRFVNAEAAPWLLQQHAAYEVAERHFEQVYLTAPVAAPEWRVAVAARIGALWGHFADQMKRFSSACGPACGDGSSDYYGTFDDPWAPQEQRAGAAFEVCITLSRKYRLLTDDTLACEAWLGRHRRFEYSVLDELVPTPHWTR